MKISLKIFLTNHDLLIKKNIFMISKNRFQGRKLMNNFIVPITVGGFSEKYVNQNTKKYPITGYDVYLQDEEKMQEFQ